jgi:hypothetical protein
MRLPALASFLLAGAALCACAPVVGIAGGSAGATFGARLGQSITVARRVVTPRAIVEDSRCPSGVQCIQAGTVRLQARVQRGAQASVATVGLGSPADIGGAWLHLAGVCPYPQVSRAIAPADYRLTLVVSGSAALPAEPIACPAR